MKRFTNKVSSNLPWLVLAILVLFIYGWFFEAPYLGFFFASSTGKVAYTFMDDPENSPMKVGDTITHINNLPLQEYYKKTISPVFGQYTEGDLIPLTIIDKSGEIHEIEWEFIGFTRAEVLERLNSGWWSSLVFYLAGTIAFLTVRPRDRIWRLFIAMNYFTAIWLAMGNGPSTYNIWGSLIILHSMVWLSIPVFLELNWLFPKPFFNISSNYKWIPEAVLFVLAIILAALELNGYIPNKSYIPAFLITIIICIGLLTLHYLLQKSTRPAISLFSRFALVSFLPLIITTVLSSFIVFPILSLGAATAFLMVLPFGYFYAIFRHRLGKLEFRANFAVTLVLYIFLLVLVFGIALGILQIRLQFNQTFFTISLATTMIAAVFTLSLFHRFQHFVERFILRIPFPTSDIVNTFSEQVTTASSTNRLVEIIQKQILPAMLIRQSALFLIDNRHHLKEVYAERLNPEDYPDPSFGQKLVGMGQNFLWGHNNLSDNLKWVRLIIPLTFDQQTIGVWLFGERDPDDFYSVNIARQLHTLANQTSIALVNNQQAQNLRALYQVNISRHEQERTSLARELHDDTLNSLTVLQRDVNDPALIQKIDQIIANLRKTVQGLRPGMLAYGLHTALEDLGDMLNERQQSTKVVVELRGQPVNLDPQFELHTYRIIQQACENALQHARAEKLRISGEIGADIVEILVEDNGIGLHLDSVPNLDGLLASGHYGLAGMIERASLINAKLSITPGEVNGTRIRLIWRKAN